NPAMSTPARRRSRSPIGGSDAPARPAGGGGRRRGGGGARVAGAAPSRWGRNSSSSRQVPAWTTSTCRSPPASGPPSTGASGGIGEGRGGLSPAEADRAAPLGPLP